MVYQSLADLVLFLHVVFIAFVLLAKLGLQIVETEAA